MSEQPAAEGRKASVEPPVEPELLTLEALEEQVRASEQLHRELSSRLEKTARE
ncbi:hypothetical protein [Nesterenkonia flava]|uniref:Nucleotide exchange factor GrpE n=1 Tax=Nesterenkonia flava TaxID=469799 RepID=A0ABU1FTM5_9MICC|nr:hypothetical protein [Nesterenkonia flava]MDR5712006.1 hypothetical protein [Nesterenkonia flava]